MFMTKNNFNGSQGLSEGDVLVSPSTEGCHVVPFHAMMSSTQ